MSARIVMLGAAPEQMAAAVRLGKAGWTVTVLEPEPRVGGRGAGAYNEPWRFDGACPWLWGPDPEGPLGRFLAAVGMAAPVFELHDAISLRHERREYSVAEARFAPPFGAGFQKLWDELLHTGPIARSALLDALAHDFVPSVALSDFLAAAPEVAAEASTTALHALRKTGDATAAGEQMLDALCRLLIGTPAEYTPLPVAAAVISTLAEPLCQPPDGVGGLLEKLVGALQFHNGKLLTTTPTRITRDLSDWTVALSDGTTIQADCIGFGRDADRFLSAFDETQMQRIAPFAQCPHAATLATLHVAAQDATTEDTHPWSVSAAPDMLLSLQTEGFAPAPLLSASATLHPAPDATPAKLLANVQQHAPELAPAPIAPTPAAHPHADTGAFLLPDGAPEIPAGILPCHIPSPMGRDLSFSLYAASRIAEQLAQTV